MTIFKASALLRVTVGNFIGMHDFCVYIYLLARRLQMMESNPQALSESGVNETREAQRGSRRCLGIATSIGWKGSGSVFPFQRSSVGAAHVSGLGKSVRLYYTHIQALSSIPTLAHRSLCMLHPRSCGQDGRVLFIVPVAAVQKDNCKPRTKQKARRGQEEEM